MLIRTFQAKPITTCLMLGVTAYWFKLYAIAVTRSNMFEQHDIERKAELDRMV
jgi:hypothetical protein